MRMFLDTIIRSLNQAITDLSPAHVYVAGHSGGGCINSVWGACDARVERSVMMQGGMPEAFGPLYVATVDYEQAIFNPMYSRAWGDYGGIVTLGASFPNRRTIACGAGGDNTFCINPLASAPASKYTEYWDDRQSLLPPGCVLQHYLGPITQGHMPDPAECAVVMAFLAAP
jgi:hypothetical protein